MNFWLLVASAVLMIAALTVIKQKPAIAGLVILSATLEILLPLAPNMLYRSPLAQYVPREALQGTLILTYCSPLILLLWAIWLAHHQPQNED